MVKKIFELITQNGERIKHTADSLKTLMKDIKSEEELLSVFGKKLSTNAPAELSSMLSSRVSGIRKINDIEQKILSARTQQEVANIVNSSGLSIEEKRLISDLINIRLRQLRSSTLETRPIIRSLPNIQYKMNQVFSRNLTQRQANELVSKYTKIFSERDNMQFTEKLVNQMIVDCGFGLYDVKVQYSKCLAEDCRAAFNRFSGIEINYNIFSKLSSIEERKLLFSTLAHELRHAQQEKIACQTDIIAYVKACAENAYKYRTTPAERTRQLRLHNGDINHVMRDVELQIGNKLLPFLKQAGRTSIPQSSLMSARGKRYIEGIRNYRLIDDVGYERYRTQLIESDAYNIGDKAQELLNLIFP